LKSNVFRLHVKLGVISSPLAPIRGGVLRHFPKPEGLRFYDDVTKAPLPPPFLPLPPPPLHHTTVATTATPATHREAWHRAGGGRRRGDGCWGGGGSYLPHVPVFFSKTFLPASYSYPL
jgi:hypothetical protein